MTLHESKSKGKAMKMIKLTEAEGRRIDPDWRGEGFISDKEMQDLLDDLQEDYRRDTTSLCPILAACFAGALIWVLLYLLYRSL
jgi:hypothetical protein